MQAHLLDLIESGTKLSADGSRNLVRISPQIVVKFGPDFEEAEALLMEYVGSHCPQVRVPTLLGTLGDTARRMTYIFMSFIEGETLEAV